MFGYKLVKKDYLEKLEHDKDHYFHKGQEVEDKNFELEEEVYELEQRIYNLKQYIEKLYNRIYNEYSFPSVNSLYRLKVHTERCKEFNYETLIINLIPIHSAVSVKNVPGLSSVIDKDMIDIFGERMGEEFKNHLVKELKRNFGYEY